jgi:hypothetical protein
MENTIHVIYEHWFDFLENHDPYNEEIVGYVMTKAKADEYIKAGGKILWGYGQKEKRDRFFAVEVKEIGYEKA